MAISWLREFAHHITYIFLFFLQMVQGLIHHVMFPSIFLIQMALSFHWQDIITGNQLVYVILLVWKFDKNRIFKIAISHSPFLFNEAQSHCLLISGITFPDITIHSSHIFNLLFSFFL